MYINIYINYQLNMYQLSVINYHLSTTNYHLSNSIISYSKMKHIKNLLLYNRFFDKQFNHEITRQILLYIKNIIIINKKIATSYVL
jgi:hypothetical protein